MEVVVLKTLAIGCMIVVATPCVAQVLTGPFNPNSPREIQIRSGTGVGISKRPAPSATETPAIGTTFGQTFGTTVGSTVGSGPVTPVGTAFGSSVGGLANP